MEMSPTLHPPAAGGHNILIPGMEIFYRKVYQAPALIPSSLLDIYIETTITLPVSETNDNSQISASQPVCDETQEQEVELRKG
jgi:hypothetical protein